MPFLSIFTECYTGPASSHRKDRRPSATPLLSKTSLPDLEVISMTGPVESKWSRFKSPKSCMVADQPKYGTSVECGDDMDMVREKLREVAFDEIVHRGFKATAGEPRPVTVQFSLTPTLLR